MNYLHLRLKLSGVAGVVICFAQISGVLVDSFVQVGDAITPYSYLAVITFDTDDCEKMCAMIEKVNNTVSIINTERESVLIYYTDFDYLKKIYKDGLEEK